MNKQTIYDLYCGNITPCDIDLKAYPKLVDNNIEILKLIDKLEKVLGSSNLELFEEYNDAINKQYAQLQYISFDDGFKLGLKLAVESLYTDNN